MQLKVILIDPAKRQISELRIPQNLNKQLLLELTGCTNLKFVWISHRTKVAFSEESEAAGYFQLPGSPRIPGKAVILDFEDGEFRAVSFSIGEVMARVRWGQATKPSMRLEARDAYLTSP